MSWKDQLLWLRPDDGRFGVRDDSQYFTASTEYDVELDIRQRIDYSVFEPDNFMRRLPALADVAYRVLRHV